MHACARGRGHRRDGSPCEDRAGDAQHGDITVIALADGCGSSRVGGLAARVAVEAVLAEEHLRVDDVSLEALARRLLQAAYEAVRDLARDLEVGTSDSSTTMMVALARGTDVVIAHVGDGVILGRAGDAWRVLSAPMNGEHANETHVLSSPRFMATARIERFEDVTACVLLTDGAASALWERATGRVASALDKLCGALETRPRVEVERWLRDELMPRLTTQTLDDCGLAFVRFEMAPEAHPEGPVTEKLSPLITGDVA